MLRSKAYIILGILLTIALPLFAKKQARPAKLTTEQQQQFSYYWYAARQAIEDERYADAYTLSQFCNAIKPNDGQTLYYLGVMYKGLGRAEDAQQAWEKSYKTEPKNAALLDQMLRMYLAKEEWKKALEIQDAIDDINGYDAYSAITRYRIYAYMKQPKKALKAIDDYLATDPDNLRFLIFRIEILDQMKSKPKVLYAAFDRVLEVDPYNLMVLNNYAWSLATNNGDLTKAEQMSAITIREEPDNPTFLDTYGWIMHLKGQDELALFYLNRALWNLKNSSQIESTRTEVEKHIRIVNGK